VEPVAGEHVAREIGLNRGKLSAVIRRLVFILSLLLLCGCPSKPTMKLNHAEVQGVTLGFPPQLGVLMNVVLDVNNPNSYDVAVRAMRGQVIFADKYPLAIDFRDPGEGIWLAADRTTTIRVPVSVPVQLALQLFREAQFNPNIPFKVSGKADVTATRTFKIEKDDYEVDESGTLTRDQMAAALASVFPLGIPR
jgi:hypothetical protein